MTVLEQIAEDGAYLFEGSDDSWGEIQELLVGGLIVRVSDIQHHSNTLNPLYTYVSNDERGRKIALDHPLFSRTLGNWGPLHT